MKNFLHLFTSTHKRLHRHENEDMPRQRQRRGVRTQKKSQQENVEAAGHQSGVDRNNVEKAKGKFVPRSERRIGGGHQGQRSRLKDMWVETQSVIKAKGTSAQFTPLGLHVPINPASYFPQATDTSSLVRPWRHPGRIRGTGCHQTQLKLAHS